VLVFQHGSGRSVSSGLEVGVDGAFLFHIRDGKVARYVAYFDRHRALAELGLEG
jgi:ketosteroid isomerase-like protein